MNTPTRTAWRARPRATIPFTLLACATMANASAQQATPTSSSDPATVTATVTLPAIQLTGAATASALPPSPATTESVDAATMARDINVVNTEDALKYLPGVLVRKRYIGDTNAPLASRTTGINASARTLVYVDGILLSTLINNNNGNGSPQWFMVAPDTIERIDLLYGPYSAAYPGNSYGAVAVIATRMPQQFEASAKVNLAHQDFSQYGTSAAYTSRQMGADLGDRAGALSWRLSVNHLDAWSQPVTVLTATQSTSVAGAALPVVNGSQADRNRTGAAIQVIGAGNLTHSVQDTITTRLALDLPHDLRIDYGLGYWRNSADTRPQTYLNLGGASWSGAASGNVNIGGYAYSASTLAAQFSAGRLAQEHLMQSLALKTRAGAAVDWEIVATRFDYIKDEQRSSTGFTSAAPNLFPAAQSGGTGRITDASGTGWSTLDANATWKSVDRAHVWSAGLHRDVYTLASPTNNTADWLNGAAGALYSDSRGTTETRAIWAQDAWRFAGHLKLTAGVRGEDWQARDGYNLNTSGATAVLAGTAFAVHQPAVTRRGLSPKLSLAWDGLDSWLTTASLGRALRFPTVGELYQNVATGATYTQANPDLRPEQVVAAELAVEHDFSDNSMHGKLRVSLFQENVRDALIAQTSTIAGVAAPVSYVQNVDRTRQRGVELVAQAADVLIRGLDLSGSLTYVDGRILANSGYVATVAGATSTGKRTPYIPDWRATVVATYRPDARWAVTLAGRYSGKMYATVDNTDTNDHTYQGFEQFFVVDTRATYALDRHWSAAAGIDNLGNRKYFLFHPFPQRTLFAELKYRY